MQQQQPQTKCLVCDNVLALIGSAAAAAVAATGTAPVPRLSVSCPVGKSCTCYYVLWCASVSQCGK